MKPASRSVCSVLVVAAHARWTERVAVTVGAPAMLLVLGALQPLTVWLFSRFANGPQPSGTRQHSGPEPRNSKRRSSLQVIAQPPHVRHLVALVLPGSTCAARLDCLFKAKDVEATGTGNQLFASSPSIMRQSVSRRSFRYVTPSKIARQRLHSQNSRLRGTARVPRRRASRQSLTARHLPTTSAPTTQANARR
jgi:hypothetical protein